MILSSDAATPAELLVEIIQLVEMRRADAAGRMQRAQTQRDAGKAEAAYRALDTLRDDLCSLGLTLPRP